MQTPTASTEPPEWFPVLEANQGAISLAALVIALVFAIIEHRRANRAAEDRRDEFRKAAMAVCDDMLPIVAGDLSNKSRLNGQVLDDLMRAPPPAPALIRAVRELRTQLTGWEISGALQMIAPGAAEARTADIGRLKKAIKDA
ncbi:MAG: hypothetical protein ACT6RD_03425 [Brevundimonas sp.]|uniref:hypothetical protein n=1 Tax=Brevundimonas sp. TaxID=1871086 RepID=UPI0040347211